jgi:hypothetical protein
MQLEWVQRYNGYGQDYDQANALAMDDSGNVYVTGSTQYVDLSTFKCVTIKYNKSGVQQWLREYQREFSTFNVGFDIAVDRNGNVYVASSTGLLRYDRSGNLVWARSDEAVMKKFQSTLRDTFIHPVWAVSMSGLQLSNTTLLEFGFGGTMQ